MNHRIRFKIIKTIDVDCKKCNNTGKLPCEQCGGTGKESVAGTVKISTPNYGSPYYGQCRRCKGKKASTCIYCGGRKKYHVDRIISLETLRKLLS